MSDRLNPDPGQVDRLLRRSLSGPTPELSSSFERRLSRQLQPRRLDTGGRVVLVLYAVAAVVFSVWVMRREAIDWVYVTAAVLVPVVASLGVYVVRSARRSAWT